MFRVSRVLDHLPFGPRSRFQIKSLSGSVSVQAPGYVDQQQDFLRATLEGVRQASPHASTLLPLFQTDPNSSPPTDSQGARSCGCQGPLGGAGQPREGQVCRHSNGTSGGTEHPTNTHTSGNECVTASVLCAVWGHDTHAHRVPRPLQRPVPARLQRASLQGSSVSKTVSNI